VNFSDVLAKAAMDKAQQRGLQVFVKTNFTPRLKVYDAAQPQSSATAASILKVGVEVKDKTGNNIVKYGSMPETDYFLASALVAIAGAVAFFAIRGVLK